VRYILDVIFLKKIEVLMKTL